METQHRRRSSTGPTTIRGSKTRKARRSAKEQKRTREEVFGAAARLTPVAPRTAASSRANLASALGGLEQIDPTAEMRREATRNVWRRVQQEFGLLTAKQAGEEMFSTAGRTNDLANRRRRQGLLMAVELAGQNYFPGFQFVDGTPHPVIKRLSATRESLGVSEEETLKWLVRPSTWWNRDGDRPVDHLDDPDGPRSIVQAFRDSQELPW